METQLKGFCQEKNTQTILTALDFLRKDVKEHTDFKALNISEEDICNGFMHVCELTGLMGRWQTLSEKPLTICDTGHNVGGWEYISKQLEQTLGTLHIVIGMVGDKDVRKVVAMLPKRAKPIKRYITICVTDFPLHPIQNTPSNTRLISNKLKRYLP